MTPPQSGHHRHRHGHRARADSRGELDQPPQRHVRRGRRDRVPDRRLSQPDRGRGPVRPLHGAADAAAAPAVVAQRSIRAGRGDGSGRGQRARRRTGSIRRGSASCSAPARPTCCAPSAISRRWWRGASTMRAPPTSGTISRARRSTSSPRISDSRGSARASSRPARRARWRSAARRTPCATAGSMPPSPGGTDAMSRLTFSGFNAIRVMDPEACRPFDRARAGMNLGEGAAMLVLEDLDAARRRGATIYAEVAGHSLTCEAFHPTSPEPDGRAIGDAIRRALDDGVGQRRRGRSRQRARHRDAAQRPRRGARNPARLRRARAGCR